MKEIQIEKVKQAKQYLESKGLMVRELANGHLQIDRINYWATTEKWYDPAANVKGIGINSFIKHLKTTGYDI